MDISALDVNPTTESARGQYGMKGARETDREKEEGGDRQTGATEKPKNKVDFRNRPKASRFNEECFIDSS